MFSQHCQVFIFKGFLLVMLHLFLNVSNHGIFPKTISEPSLAVLGAEDDVVKQLLMCTHRYPLACGFLKCGDQLKGLLSSRQRIGQGVRGCVGPSGLFASMSNVTGAFDPGRGCASPSGLKPEEQTE